MMVHKKERGGGHYHYARCGAERDSLNSLWYFWHKVTCAECLDLDGRCRKCTRFVDYPELLNHCKCNAALQPCPTCQRWMLEKCSACEPTARNTVAAGTIFRPCPECGGSMKGAGLLQKCCSCTASGLGA